MERKVMGGRGPLWLAIVAVLVLTTGAIGAEPDWNRLDDPLVGAVGLHAGKMGGTGLSFKWPLVWYLQLQGTGGLWHTGDDKRHNVGLEIQYLLRQDPRLRFYLASGWSYSNHQEKVSGTDDDWRGDPDWNAGFGVGFEYLMGARWSVKSDVDFTYQRDKDSITIWPQLGLYFYW
jgi:hypothetical protein